MTDQIKTNYDDQIYDLYEKAKHHACRFKYNFDRGNRGRAAWQKTRVLARLKQIPLYKLLEFFEKDLSRCTIEDREISVLFRAMSDLYTHDQVTEFVEDPVISSRNGHRRFKEEFSIITLQGMVAFSSQNKGKPPKPIW